MVFKDLNSTINHTQVSAILFSTSFNGRNNLRRLMNDCGFNAVCFENEAICYDNFQPIQPKLVMVDTDSAEVVWRFVFAIYVNASACPLIIVSDQLSAALFNQTDLPIPLNVISRDLQNDQLSKTIQALGEKMEQSNKGASTKLHILVGQTPSIKAIKSLLPVLSNTYDPILVSGEKGTGKELLTRMVIGLSPYDMDCIKINCNEINQDMLINGGLKHALSLGTNSKTKLFFLDRIDRLPIDCQAGMLLLIEAAYKYESGLESQEDGRARFIATSELKIDVLKQRDDFRKDLFYSLSAIPVEMPPLRERKEDISLLMDYIMINACKIKKQCVMIPSNRARQACFVHDWPGNIDELQRVVMRMVEYGDEMVLLDHTQQADYLASPKERLIKNMAFEELPKPHEIRHYLPEISETSLKDICNAFVTKTERRLLKRALEATSWNRKKAAELLNISYKSMLNKIKVYDIV